MMILTRRALLAGTAALTAAGMVPFRAVAAARIYHALLVACTDYPNLPQKNWLIGPKNDAGLVRDYLLSNVPAPVKFAPENVTLLADGVDGARGSPTHAEISAALASLAAKVQRDDFVYLHLSGHGAQQPQAKAGNETDGLDEIFLPKDIDKWVNRDKGVPNALMDDEIGAALDAIRDKGAFIWAVFDCCHSGTATRGAEADESERKVEATDLGIPEAEMEPAQAASRSYRRGRPARAGFQPDADRRRADHQGQDGRLLRGADHRDDAGNAAAQGQSRTPSVSACSPSPSSPSSPKTLMSPTASSARRCCSNIRPTAARARRRCSRASSTRACSAPKRPTPSCNGRSSSRTTRPRSAAACCIA